MRTRRAGFFVPWSQCDAAGIVFYPHIYVWFDESTENLFRANGLGYGALESELGLSGMPLVETGATYRNPCRLGDALEIETWVDDWGKRSFLVRHVVRHGDGRIALEGFERRVLVAPDPDAPKGIRAVEIPASVIARFVD